MREATVDELLIRMRAGERDAAGEFITRFGPRLRARLRFRLSQSMRRVFDSQDVLSTVARRLDACVRAGAITAATPEQLWSLVLTIARHSLAEKGRIISRLQRVEDEDSDVARAILRRLEDAQRQSEHDAEATIEHAFTQLSDPTDRQILGMWLVGTPLAEIAACLGLAAGTVRWKWSQIRDTLRVAFT